MGEPENIILEHLKRFQSGQDRIERELKEIKGRLSQVEIGIGLLGSDTNFAAAHGAAPFGRAEGSANLGSDPKNPWSVPQCI